jgi:class 3 adenylate cyclase
MAAQTATILVTDLVGSTALREALGEERAEFVRREHDRALIDAAQSNGGTVVKSLGDGVLVMFAGAAEAVAAATAMQRAIDLQARNGGLALSIRVGISAGDVTLEDGDCFGTPVVEASRLCGAADGRHILVAQVVRVLARGRGGHEMTSIGELELKGLSEPVPTFDVGWVPAEGVADLRARTPYVGRSSEREVLAGRLAAARDGMGGLVLIAGEPGIGKTRLAAEVCGQAEQLLVLVGGCHDGDVVPYAPFAEALTDWARRTPAAQVRSALGDDAAVVARVAPAIRAVVPDAGEPMSVPPDAETARLHDAVGQVLERLSQISPVALIVEDLHWADDATVGMVRSLSRLAARTRLLVIGTYRETDLDRRHPFAHALPLLQREVEPTRISLDGLVTDDVHVLLERLSGHTVPEAFAALLATETDGNPFFLRETLLHLVDEGWLRFEDGAWVADATRELSIPAGVRDVVGRRLSRLSKDANRLLGAGALFEVSFPLVITAAVTDIGEDEALDAIDEALEARIVAPTDEFDRYAFTHALFRHTLVEELNPSRQVRMHRAIAEAMEKDLRGPPDAPTAATLARHYLRSAAIPGAERGVPYAIAVADDAADRYARHEELAALGIALELVESHDERTILLRRRLAAAAVLAQIDPDDLLAEAEATGRLIAAEEGDDAACDFVAGLLISARALDDIRVCWRLAALTRSWLRPERRDWEWVVVRDTELSERDYKDPTAPGIPSDDDDYRELRSVAAELRRTQGERELGLTDSPSSRAEATERLAVNPDHFLSLLASGAPRACIRLANENIERSRRERLVGLEAMGFAIRSRCEALVGDFDAAAASLDAAFALMPRISPESNPAFQVLATPMLRDNICGVDLAPELVDFLLEWADRPDTKWIGLVLRLAAARALALNGDAARALSILDASIPSIERAAAWAVNAPLVFAYAIEIAWMLERTEHLAVLERNAREKWLDPDLCYPGTDSRWHVALLCALDGRVEEARELFAESRRVLLEQDSEPVIVAVDYDAALMELRLEVAGDAQLFAECIAAARARCNHLAMAAWLPRLDALEARAATTF